MELNKARIEIIGYYLCIGALGYFIYRATPDSPLMLRFLLANLCMTLLAFGFSLVKKNSSVYDAYWSVIPFFLACFWFREDSFRWTSLQWITAGILSLWSWRLTHNWYRSWQGWQHEDWRYVGFRKTMGRHFIWMNFFGLHLYPTLIVFTSMLGLFSIFGQPFTGSIPVFIAGALLALTGVWLEWSADNTLFRSKRDGTLRTGEVLRSGLWAYSRNPNYLGEILFWWGIAVMGLSNQAAWWTALGALGMLCMFLFASIPMKEKRLLENRSEAFLRYKSEVPKLIPSPRLK
jgi:steroid 5-alpha reductase family enzyme